MKHDLELRPHEIWHLQKFVIAETSSIDAAKHCI